MVEDTGESFRFELWIIVVLRSSEAVKSDYPDSLGFSRNMDKTNCWEDKRIRRHQDREDSNIYSRLYCRWHLNKKIVKSTKKDPPTNVASYYVAF